MEMFSSKQLNSYIDNTSTLKIYWGISMIPLFFWHVFNVQRTLVVKVMIPMTLWTQVVSLTYMSQNAAMRYSKKESGSDGNDDDFDTCF